MLEKTEEGPKEEKEERSTGIVLFIGMGCFILITQLLALLLATPMTVADIIAFENKNDPLNPLIFFVFIIAFTAFILVVLKYFKHLGEKLVYFVMLGAVTMTIFYVPYALLYPDVAIPLIITLALVLLLYKYPEWYVLDATGLILGGGAAAIFGISLGILPVLLLLGILMVYDAIAVYKTKHMVALAESVIDLHMPVLFVLPRKWSFSLVRGDAMEDGFYMGLGDAIIPTVLVVAANYMPGFVYYFGLINGPALGALIGTLAGYAVLSRIAGRGKPHAGLPFLNSGAIVGFAIGYLALML
mgnify:CR=1 FL=1